MLSNVNIRMKLLIGIIITTVILFASASIIYIANNGVKMQAQELENQNLVRIDSASRIKDSVNALTLSLQRFNLTGDSSVSAEVAADLEALQAEIASIKIVVEENPELTTLGSQVKQIEENEVHFEELQAESEFTLNHIIMARSNVREEIMEVETFVNGFLTNKEEEIEVAFNNGNVDSTLIEKLLLELRTMEDINFKLSQILEAYLEAQIDGDYEGLETAVGSFDGLNSSIDQLIEMSDVEETKNSLKAFIDDLGKLKFSLEDLMVAQEHMIMNIVNIQAVADTLVNIATDIETEGLKDGVIGAKNIASEVENVGATLLIGIALAIFISIISNTFIALSITKPLKLIVKANKDLGKLDFSNEYPELEAYSHRADEVGVLAVSTIDVVKNIKILLKDMNSSVGKLSGVAQESMAISQNIDTSASDQSSMMDDVSATVTEVAESINETAKTVLELAELIGNSNDKGQQVLEQSTVAIEMSEEGKVKMEQLTNAMNAIVVSMDSLGDSIGNLGESAEEIRGIVQFINDIADQTNLLALNAAIEAARAGDAGRGFAVVAEEIRTLAEDSTKSTDRINDLVNRMEDVIASTIEISGESKVNVDESSAVIGDTNKAFDEIFNSVKNNSEMVHEIIDMLDIMNDKGQSVAGTSQEQAASAEEIASSVESVTEIAAEVSEGSKTMSSSAGEVTAVSNQINEMVSQFKV